MVPTKPGQDSSLSNSPKSPGDRQDQAAEGEGREQPGDRGLYIIRSISGRRRVPRTHKNSQLGARSNLAPKEGEVSTGLRSVSIPTGVQLFPPPPGRD